jgi:hypothetical protein
MKYDKPPITAPKWELHFLEQSGAAFCERQRVVQQYFPLIGRVRWPTQARCWLEWGSFHDRVEQAFRPAFIVHMDRGL